MSKIRVLHTFNIMNRAGAETLVMNIFRNIDKEKYEFNFLCENPAQGDYDDEIESLGGKIFHLKPNKRNIFKNIDNIVTFLKKNGPYDAIHIPNMFYSGIYCIAAKKAGIKKIIVHSHSAGDEKKSNICRKIYRIVMRKLINKYSNVKISCGYDAAKFLFGTTEDVIILNNGVDIEKYVQKNFLNKYKKEFDIKGEKIIANIARFVPEKNHEFFIKLGNYIKSNKLNYKILLVGDGKLKEKIYKEIEKNKLNDVIICTGLRTDINYLLNFIDIIVMPSLHEGFPVTIIEALASGTPCVLSSRIDVKTAIVPELIKFVDLESDCAIWINEIENLLNKDVKISEIHRILKKNGFDIKTAVKNLEKIYGNK